MIYGDFKGAVNVFHLLIDRFKNSEICNDILARQYFILTIRAKIYIFPHIFEEFKCF